MNKPKRLFPWIVSIILLFSGAAWADIPVVTEADLYSSGARLVLTIPATESMTIELPATLDRKSIHVRTTGKLELNSMLITEKPRNGWIPPALLSLNNQIENVGEKIAQLNAYLSALRQSAKQLSDNVPDGLDTESLPKYIGKAAKNREAVENRIAVTEKKIADTTRLLNDLKAELKSKMPGVKNRVLVLSARTTGTGNLILDGWTRYSSWSPEYRLNLDHRAGAIEGKLVATVIQNSGLDYNGDIRLHTVMPVRRVDPPKMPPQMVGFFKDMPSPSRESVNMLSKSTSFPIAAAPSIETLNDVIFPVKGTISGDGTPLAIELQKYVMNAKTEIVCVPYISNTAWLLATVARLDHPLLPAKATLYVNGKAVGRTSLPEAARGSKLKLAFGTIPSVRARREKVIPKEGSNWTGKGKLNDGYTITVTNGLPQKETITLRDRLPVSTQKSISVEIVSVEPWYTEKDKKGILTWKFNLNSGESKEISLLYRIKYPAEKKLNFR